MSDVIEQIPQWIKSKVESAGMKGCIVGLSGGIDSAVTVVLCKKALGDKVIGVVMPCKSHPNDLEDAWLIAKRFNIQTVTVKLDKPYESLAGELQSIPEIHLSNVKPRLRMATLYAFANHLSYLVVGTGNKSELMIGYFTKHGDGGVDILPIGDLYKFQVRQLAYDLGIPEKIILKPPSAGLWDKQTDEDEIGIGYEELDKALMAIESQNTGAVADRTQRRVEQMVGGSAHKRALPSICKLS